MKLYISLICILLTSICYSFDYEVRFENENVRIEWAYVYPYEEIELHRDDYQHLVIAVQGGTITRIEEDGTIELVDFPTGMLVVRQIDPPGQYHRSYNDSPNPVELTIIQIKK